MKDSYVFYKDKLQGEYKNVFDQVEMYVNCENIDRITREDRLSSLLDMLLTAQESGRPVKKVVGNSIEDFCQMFCSDMGTQNKIWRVLDTLKVIAVIELIFAFFDLLSADWSETDFWSVVSNVNASGYLLGFAACIFIGYITHFAVRSFMFKRKKLNMNLLKGIETCMIVVSFIVGFLILSSDKLNFFTCPVWAVMLVSAVYLIFYFIFNRKRSSENKQQKVNFHDVVSEKVNADFDTIMEKRYNVFNKRNIKKGNGELSMREFLDNEEKDCEKSLNNVINNITYKSIETITQTTKLNSLENLEESIFIALSPILLLVVIQLVSSKIALNSNKTRELLDGSVSVIINRGKVNFKEMLKQRYNLDDLLSQLRGSGIKSIEEVDYAVLETSGKLSIFKRSDDSSRTYPLPLIVDGEVDEDVLLQIKKSRSWLDKRLEEEGYSLEDVFYGFYKENNLYLIKNEIIK